MLHFKTPTFFIHVALLRIIGRKYRLLIPKPLMLRVKHISRKLLLCIYYICIRNSHFPRLNSNRVFIFYCNFGSSLKRNHL